MNATWTIAKREVTSLFFSPAGYVALIVFSFVTTLLFFTQFSPGAPASLRTELNWVVWLLVFIAPAMSMRSLSEELRSGTIELLMTAPINDIQVVAGKWLGAMLFFLTLLIPVLVHVLILEWCANPDYGPIFTGLLGLILVGGLYLSIGVFASSMTANQIIAFMTTVLITGFLTIGLYMLARAQWVPAWLQDTMFYVNVDQQFEDFAKGLIDTSNFVFFISGILLFLFCAVKLLESRRWR